MRGQLAGLVNEPRHKDEDDKVSEEALVAARRGFKGPAQQSAGQRQTDPCCSGCQLRFIQQSPLLERSCQDSDNSLSPPLH